MKVGLLITARLKSTRLPLKLLIQLQGREVIRHVIDRAKAVQGIDTIVLCTSPNPQDCPLVDIAKEENIHYFLGDEDDVLNRLKDAATFFGIDSFISITADNPFFCVYHANRVSDLLRRKPDTDYAFLTGLPIGAAVYGLRTKATQVVCQLKEQVDTEIWGVFVNHPNILAVEEINVEAQWQFDARLTLDTPEDLEFMISLLLFINRKVFEINTLDVKKSIEMYSELRSINNNIIQKGIEPMLVAEVKNLFENNRDLIRKQLGHVV